MATRIISYCDATIPIDEQNGMVCGAIADCISEAGPRCAVCLAEFGGVIVTAEYNEVHPLKSSPAPVPFDLGSLMCSVLDSITEGAA